MGDMSTPSRGKPDHGTTENPSFTVGGQAYEDEEQMRFAFTCSTMGFGLPSFDDFIDDLPDGIGKQELLDWRQQAFNAFKNHNEHALKGWLEAAYINWTFRLTADHIRPTVAMGLRHQEAQSQKGKKGAEKRWNRSHDGDLRMDDLIKDIALSSEHMDWNAQELWPELYSKLDQLHLNPAEQEDGDDWKKSVYSYDTPKGRESITGGRFANVVSKHRRAEKSR